MYEYEFRANPVRISSPFHHNLYSATSIPDFLSSYFIPVNHHQAPRAPSWHSFFSWLLAVSFLEGFSIVRENIHSDMTLLFSPLSIIICNAGYVLPYVDDNLSLTQRVLYVQWTTTTNHPKWRTPYTVFSVMTDSRQAIKSNICTNISVFPQIPIPSTRRPYCAWACIASWLDDIYFARIRVATETGVV